MIVVPDDAYATVADADAYHNKRPSKEAWGLLTDEQKEQRLVSASDYLDSAYRFRYSKTDPAQSRQFPRRGMTDIPLEVVKAVLELSNHQMASGSLTAATVQNKQRVKVDVIEVEYAASDKTSGTPYPLIDGLLHDWIIKDGLRMGAIIASDYQIDCACG